MERETMYWRINFRLCIANKLLLTAGLFVLIPFLHGVTYLDAQYSADCLEKYVALTGLLLFPALAAPEQEREIFEMVAARPKAHWKTLGQRICMAGAAVYLCILAFGALLRAGHCEFPYWAYTAGTFCTAAALGSFGLLGAVISRNYIAGYLASLGYYLANLFGGPDKMGPFFLNSMTAQVVGQKPVLLCISGVCLILSIIRIRYQK